MSAPATVTLGIVDDMPEAEYHAHLALSQSGAKTLLASPARFAWERAYPKPPTEAMEHGSLAHRMVLGVGPDFEVIDADDWRKSATRVLADDLRTKGILPILGKDFERIDAMARALQAHGLAMDLLVQCEQREVSIFADCPATGVAMRGRLDGLGTRLLVDYKTTVKADAMSFGRSAHDYGYHIQAAWYLDLMEFIGEPREGFAFIVQSKVAPYEVAVCELAERAVDRGRHLGMEARERYRDCAEAGVWPGAVDPRSVLVVDLPPWGYRDNDYTEEVST